MATHIELEVIDVSDLYEKTSPRLFNKALISGIEWDDHDRIWFTYEGKEIKVRCKYEDFRRQLLE